MENVAQIRPQTAAAIADERRSMSNLPTSRLNTMIADAHQSIALLDENEEHLRAGLKVTLEAARAKVDERAERINTDVAELRKQIEQLMAERERLYRDHDASVAAGKEDVDAQLAAIGRMRDAQRAVVSSLANDITPAPAIGHEPPAKKARTKAS